MQKKAEQPTIATKERGILTTAFGDRPYLNRALSLARSCHFHSPQAPLAIITDQPEDKGLRRRFDYILPFTQPQDHSKSLSWKSFEHKLHLDKLSPFKKTIFLDSDCLLYADVSNLFERFAGHVFQPSDLSILPPRYVQGCCKRWLMDLNKVCRHYDIRTLLRFNGGCFYYENDSAESEAFFATVREVFQLCKDNNWIRKLTIEPIYAIAMQLTKINLDYSPRVNTMLKCTLIASEQRDKLCILRNRHTLFVNEKNVSIQVIHFLEHTKTGALYLRETLKLKVQEFIPSPAIAAFGVTLAYHLTFSFFRLFKLVWHLRGFASRSIKYRKARGLDGEKPSKSRLRGC